MVDGEISLILASASPRRRELLETMGCVFSIQSSDVDEKRNQGETARNYVMRLSREKAQVIVNRSTQGDMVATKLAATEQVNANTVAGKIDPTVAVLAADTIVIQGETVFSKPRDQQHAFRMWRQLANSKHHVITAVCLAVRDKVEIRTVRSMVEFGAIDDQQMLRYWRSGEPQDKAGGYAIQGLASAWVKLIHGSYSNVVGLPLRETNELLKKVGHNWL